MVAITFETSTPMMAAISRSSATARIERPSMVRCTSAFSAHIIAPAIAAMTRTRTEIRTPNTSDDQLREKRVKVL